MKNKSRAVTHGRDRQIWDSPLVWYGLAVYSFAALVFFWPDFAKIIAWVGA